MTSYKSAISPVRINLRADGVKMMSATQDCRKPGSKCSNFELKHVNYNPTATNCDLTGNNEVEIQISIEGKDSKSSKTYVNHYYALELKVTNTPFLEFSKDKQNWSLMCLQISSVNTNKKIDSRATTPEKVYVRKCSGAQAMTATVECKLSHSATSDLCKPCNHLATIFIDVV